MYINLINIQLRNTDNIRTDLYILLKPQSELGYLGLGTATGIEPSHVSFTANNAPDLMEVVDFSGNSLLSTFTKHFGFMMLGQVCEN